MTLEHIRFSFVVELLSDCHIGDGEARTLAELRPFAAAAPSPDGDLPKVYVATIVRDFHGNPILPATALKGALKKNLDAQLPRNDIEALFGAIKNDDQGAMGRFTFYFGACDAKLRRDAEALPHWNSEKGSWIATHVAISRETGASDHMKLHNVEMLPAGTVFNVSGIWFGALEQAKEGLKTLLAPLAGKEGLSVGSGQKLGLGAIRFYDVKEQVSLNQTRFQSDTGEVESKPIREKLSIQAPQLRRERVDLKLRCEGPFLSVDTAKRKGSNQGNFIAATKRNSQTPVLQIHALAGALRTRATWLSECEGWGGDDRFRKPSTWENPEELTPVERLFGVGGWRGLLRFFQTSLPGAEDLGRLTSIAIDRFSGAVLDSALFEFEVFTGVELDVSLALETRGDGNGRSFPNDRDKHLFDLILRDLNGDTLMLGHAVNRGFGWFDVVVNDQRALKENG